MGRGMRVLISPRQALAGGLWRGQRGGASETCRDVKSRADALGPQIAKHTQLGETMPREAAGVRGGAAGRSERRGIILSPPPTS